jgi:hypothetical protein
MALRRLHPHGRVGLMGEAKDIWAERARLLAPDQVNADLVRKAQRL